MTIIVPKDQIDDEPIQFTTSIPPLRNQFILATPAISLGTTLYSSQYFLTTNSLLMSSKLTALGTRCCKMVVITSYLKNEPQLLKIGENSPFDIALMHDTLKVCLQLEKLSPFPQINKQLYCCRSIPSFFDVYCICWEAYFHDDVKSDDGYFLENCSGCGKWHLKKCMKVQVQVFLR